MQDFPSYTSPSLNTHKMVNEDDMKKALAEIESSSKPNYTEIAQKHGLVLSTLLRRVQGKTTSRAEFQSQVHQCLTNAQERVLINQVNRLTERGIPPTSQMVKNFAEEMIGHAVGKNWVGEFCRRHKSELKSLYLRNIDNLRVKGEYGPIYKLFYDLVRCFLYCFIVLYKN
jgi:Tc5 transposase DNA-binding domain